MAFLNIRTRLNEGDNTNNVASSDNGPSVETAAALYFQGNSSISAQFTNAQEYLTYDQEGATDTTFSLDLSDSTVWVLYKDNLVDTQANGGVQVVIGNGTGGNSALIGYYVGGTDNPGLSLNKQFNVARLDVSNRAAFSTNAHNGNVGGLSVTGITNIGYGSVHAIAARGNVDNVWVDAVYYSFNNGYACRFEGTTLNTFSDAVTTDETNGWGLISSVGDQVFTLYGNLEFGNGGISAVTVADSGKTVILDGRGLGTSNFLMRSRASTGAGAVSLTYSNMSFINLGTGIVIDLTPTIDTLSFTDITFSDTSTISFPTTFDSNRNLTRVAFNRTGAVDFGATTATDCSFNNSQAVNGAMVLDSTSDSSRQSNISFTRGSTTAHAIQINDTGTYSLNNFNFSGYATTDGTTGTEVIYNTSGGAVTLNVTGGTGTISVRNLAGGSVTINQTFSLTVSGLLGNTEVRVYDNPSLFTGGGSSVESSTPAGYETVEANTNVGNGTNYIFYNTATTNVQVSAAGLAGILSTLEDGDKFRVLVRDNADNPTLQLFDEFEVDGILGSNFIPTTTPNSGFTSVFGSVLNSSNSKTVTIEKVDASASFTVSSGTYDVFVYRTGSLPIITKGLVVNSNTNLPITQAGDRVYKNPS